MTAGLQVWNDSNYLQVDGDNQHIVLLGKGQTTGTQLNHMTGSQVGSLHIIPVPAGCFLALRGQAPWYLSGRYNGNWYINMVGAGAGSWLQYWVFGPYQPSGINYGLEVYNGSGQLIYDSGRLPLRYVQEIAGVGSWTVGQAGRDYALVPQIFWTHFTRNAQPLSSNTSIYVLTWLLENGLVNVSGQTVTSVNQSIMADAPGQQSNVTGYNLDVTNNLQNTVTVLDVTGY